MMLVIDLTLYTLHIIEQLICGSNTRAHYEQPRIEHITIYKHSNLF